MRVRWNVILLVLLGLAVLIAALVAFGMYRWQNGTEALRVRLEKGRAPVQTTRFDPACLDTLPAPVQRFFRAALTDGQAMVAGVTLKHAGTFNMSETGDDWKPFTSNQRVITNRPGFDWDARINIAPGLDAFVHDAFVDGEGLLHASVLGLVSIMDLRGTPDVAQGELFRFLAETAWYPTVLLPGQGTRWEGVDDSSARATVTDGSLAVTMLFRFRKDGLISSVRAEDRLRIVGDGAVPTPWEGRWSEYVRRDGMMIPLEGEVAWITPEGRRPYWRGLIQEIRYDY